MRFVAALLVLLSLCFIVFAEVPATPMINNDDGETSWVLNTQVSDEFNQGVLDRKWGQQLGTWKGTRRICSVHKLIISRLRFVYFFFPLLFSLPILFLSLLLESL